jgi:uncharacterized OB-fold protein
MELTPALDATGTQLRLRVDRTAGRLVGTTCNTCGTSSWPGRAICFHCGSADCAEVTFSPEGQLTTHTTVWVPRPGLEPPYTLAQVDLPEGIRVFAHARDLEAGQPVPFPVRLVIAPEEGAVPPFWFVPSESA